VLRSGSPRLAIQEAWAWLTATQLTHASEAAARALRRKDGTPVTADEESFTAARRHMIRSMATTQVTATSSLDAIAAAADAAARAVLHTLNVAARQRHAERARKARPKFRHATATKPTVTGKPQVTVFAPGFS
jgi:Flp pilus assembly protein TadG